MKNGISIYPGTSPEQNRKLIEKAKKANVSCVFTSLQINEDDLQKKKKALQGMLRQCAESEIPVFADVNPQTKDKLSIHSFEELKEWGVAGLRLDYGFSNEEAAALSRKFQIVLNASTLKKDDLEMWERAGADLTKVIACHNYYPKPYTGLSVESVREKNQWLHTCGISTMGFVPGDGMLRGPLYEGLPTIENHRKEKAEVPLHMLELHEKSLCDWTLVGDIDISERAWEQLESLNNGYITLHADINRKYEYLRESIHHDRNDSSDFLFRSVESRQVHKRFAPENCVARTVGSICVSNQSYLRYEGEMEIARIGLPADERVNVAGYICEEDVKYLPYIKDGMGILLKQSANG